MALVSLKCNNCNGNLSLEANKTIGFCPYCGAKYIHETPINNYTTNITNTFHDTSITIVNNEQDTLFKAAEAFMNMREYDAAAAKYRQITNNYPQNYKGWYGLAQAESYYLQKKIPIPLPKRDGYDSDFSLFESRCRTIESYYNNALSLCQDNTMWQKINSDYKSFHSKKKAAISDYKQRKSVLYQDIEKAKQTKKSKRTIAYWSIFFVIYIPVFLLLFSGSQSVIGSALLGLVITLILYVIGSPIFVPIVRCIE